MQVYLVGGAVRDALLGYPFSDKDWVVVGSTPQQMLAAGYQSIGKDFPVFLHPDSHEEYALARTERKQGQGYKGFTIFAAPEVTLEQDLMRRDLTINAIAQDSAGKIYDPYGGVDDLHNKQLRHVSEAFTEDPLRVLRVARFAARYQHLGFTIAGETAQLMRQLADSGELQHLTRERIWQETHRALGEQTPDVYFQVLRDCHALQAVIPELDQLFGSPQPGEQQEHQPGGEHGSSQPGKEQKPIDCGERSVMALKQACVLSNDPCVRFAALMHYIGRGGPSESERSLCAEHKGQGVNSIETLCKKINTPNAFRDLAKITQQFYGDIDRALELEAATILEVIEKCDGIRKPQRFDDVLLTCEAINRDCAKPAQSHYLQADFLRAMLKTIGAVSTKSLAKKGLRGKAFGQALRNKRIGAINEAKSV